MYCQPWLLVWVLAMYFFSLDATIFHLRPETWNEIELIFSVYCDLIVFAAPATMYTPTYFYLIGKKDFTTRAYFKGYPLYSSAEEQLHFLLARNSGNTDGLDHSLQFSIFLRTEISPMWSCVDSLEFEAILLNTHNIPENSNCLGHVY